MVTTKLTSDSIDTFIARSAYWNLSDDDQWVAYFYDEGGETTCRMVSDVELALCHNKLPQAMRAMLEYCKKYDNPLVVHTEELADTLLLLRNEHLTLKSGTRKNVFKKIENLVMDDPIGDEVVLLGTTFSTWTCQKLGEPITVATYCTFSSMSLTHDELEQQVPGWRNRLDTGIALGIENDELYHYVFFENRHHANVSDMNGLNFD